MSLTDRQQQIVRGAREWIAEHGEEPSLRELAEAAGLASASSAHYQVQRLRKLGVVIETRGRPSRRCPHCGK
ncbi:helix-turn-helix domain-containing protein [Streptomyces flavofungini]|uniref:LexA family protein n=1 Tax=Streptomyces flavofungini TaxID=68200 RepID=UPI0025B094B3|nr:helix-turn-helix domain-containing protein [Streptomyces flavofungini]WJV48895.1 helix-turn-helix domain-containing protein [Streptomyces flavofungini]